MITKKVPAFKNGSISTVNVVETDSEGNLVEVNSYPDTPEGNKQAEERFSRIVRKIFVGLGITKEEILEGLEDGVFRSPAVGDGSAIYVIHSS